MNSRPRAYPSRSGHRCGGRLRFVDWGVALAGLASVAAAEVGVEHTVVGRLDVHAGIASPALPLPRHLYVLLPAAYDTTKRYPVIYAQDGQDLFDEATAAGREEWALDELLAARPEGIPDVIVVGIEALPQALQDCAPPGSMDGARGDAYLQLLTEVVKPFVEARYATAHGAGNALLLGQGSGGVLALYAAWSRPDLFGGAIAFELPDLDAASLAWAQSPPRRARPRLWIEQSGGDVAQRPSTTQLLATLRRGAEVQFLVAGPRSPRVACVAAGMRALLSP